MWVLNFHTIRIVEMRVFSGFQLDYSKSKLGTNSTSITDLMIITALPLQLQLTFSWNFQMNAITLFMIIRMHENAFFASELSTFTAWLCFYEFRIYIFKTKWWNFKWICAKSYDETKLHAYSTNRQCHRQNNNIIFRSDYPRIIFFFSKVYLNFIRVTNRGCRMHTTY